MAARTPPATAGDVKGLAARRAALRAITAVETRGAYSNLVVPREVAALADPRDRALATMLAYDTLRWQGTLDWALGRVLRRRRVEAKLMRVLRLGAYQLLRTDIPPAAVVHTAVALAREQVPPVRADAAASFVNGVLRALAREREQLPWPGPEDPVAHLALRTAHPEWVVEELLQRYPFEEVAALLEADDQPPGLTLRAVGDPDALVAELRAVGVEAERGRWAPEAVRAPGADPRELDAVAEGRAVPQDEASMMVVHALGVHPGERVIDLCAGPGGKTTHLAQLGAEVTAVEVHPHRAELVRRSAAALGFEVEVVVADAREVDLPPADAVLVDAPCSDLGVGRRRPEVRWRRRPEDVEALADLQRQLLRAALRLVRPGGRVVYAVCTWTHAETDAVVDAVAAETGAVVVDRRRWWPHHHDTDAMFHATLRPLRGR